MLTPEVNLGNVTGMGDIINTIHLWGGTRWGPRRQTVMRIHSRGRSNTIWALVCGVKVLSSIGHDSREPMNTLATPLTNCLILKV